MRDKGASRGSLVIKRKTKTSKRKGLVKYIYFTILYPIKRRLKKVSFITKNLISYEIVLDVVKQGKKTTRHKVNT